MAGICVHFRRFLLKRCLTLITAALVVASFGLITAQGIPSAPRNLRIVTGGGGGGGGNNPGPPPCVVPAARGGAHAYFDALVRRAEHSCNWSLRDQAQLDALTNDNVSTFFTYSPATDSYPQAQDAAKFLVPAGRASASIPGTQQLKMGLPRIDSGTVLITWDWYWGPEFRSKRGDMRNYKAWQLMIDGHAWWTLMTNLSQAGGDANEVTKTSDEFRPGTRADGMIRNEKVLPSGPGTPTQYPNETYPQYHSRWTRYWVEVKLLQPPSAFREWSDAYLGGAPLRGNSDDPSGRWHMVSLWSADENRNAQRLLYRVPMNWDAATGRQPHVSMFRFEMNSSQETGFIGPFVGYGRNVVVLHNYTLPATNPETDAFLFQRPTR
jgi:hypothetical protein